MAKSSSKKKLESKLRHNKESFDPRLNRGSWNGIKPITKIRENKKKNDCYYDSAYKLVL